MSLKQHVFKAYIWFEGPEITQPTHGKRFTIHAIRHSQSAAEKITDGLGKKGYYTRVVQYAPGVNIWGVYARKKDK